jgi:predicted permease
MLDRIARVIRLRARSLIRPAAVDQELDDELRFHLDQAIAHYRGEGLTAGEARRRALADLHGLESPREACRSARTIGVATAFRDLRVAIRSLRRSPLFSALSVVVLALGIGGAASMFSVVYGVLLRPLRLPDADRLFALSSKPSDFPIDVKGLLEAHYLNVETRDTLFEGVATWRTGQGAVLVGGEPRRASITGITGRFFSLLRVRPVAGRLFDQRDIQAGRSDLAVLSQEFWREAFSSRPEVIGSTLMVDGRVCTVVGVAGVSPDMPAGVPDIWIPTTVRVDPHNGLFGPAIARLKPGVTRRDAAAELAVLAAPSVLGEPDGAWHTEVLPLADLLVGDTRRPLLLFAGAIALLLLVGCANAAGLMVARTADRQRELAIRTALGAGRGRLVRQLVLESCVVAVVAGAAGLALAAGAVPLLLRSAPPGSLSRLDSIGIDGVVAAFTLMMAMVCGIGAGLLPALRATRPGRPAMDRRHMVTDHHERLRGALTIAEIALSLVLLAAAGLMLRSFIHLRAVPLGFQPQGVATARIDLPARYDSAARKLDFERGVLDRLSRGSDATLAATVDNLPFGGQWRTGDFALEDGRTLPEGLMALKMLVSPHYFEVLGVELVRGRDFTEADRAGAPGVVVVSRSLAAELWPGQNAIGQRLAMSPQPHLTIVGVAADVRSNLAEPTPRIIYQPYAQAPHASWLNAFTVIARSPDDPPAAASRIRRAVAGVDAAMAPPDVIAMTDVVQSNRLTPEFQTWLMVTFAAVALGLTVVGIYGVLAYTVSRRLREFGVRIALGATRDHLLGLVLRRTFRLTLTGIVLGLGGALAAARLLASFLFEVTPWDPLSFAGAASLLMLTALLAAALPAWRATRVDPTVALRDS